LTPPSGVRSAPAYDRLAALHHPRRHRPGLKAVFVARPRDINQRGASEPPARRKHRQRFEDVGLARAIRTEQAYGSRIKLKRERGMIAKVRKREACDVQRVQRHTLSGIST
jgi:hypothetical protein